MQPDPARTQYQYKALIGSSALARAKLKAVTSPSRHTDLSLSVPSVFAIMPENVERSSKRSRSDPEDIVTASTPDTDSSPAQETARDGEFWLVDGNIVLIAGQVAFKVYKGLLAKQSPVFSDVFSSANSESSQLLDRTPVVHLSDSPEDLRHLLHALLPNKKRSLYLARKDLPFHQLSALVRLSHKYQIDDLQAQAVSALQTYFVSDFASLENWNPAFEAPDGCGIEMIYLARLLEMPNLLPMASYTATFVGGRVADGWALEDGTRRYLEPDDLRRYIDGFGTLRARGESTLARIFNAGVCFGCMEVEGCGEALHEMYTRNIKPLRNDRHLLRSWESVNLCEKYNICDECVDTLEMCFGVERSWFWKELPTIFGVIVEGWDAST